MGCGCKKKGVKRAARLKAKREKIASASKQIPKAAKNK